MNLVIFLTTRFIKFLNLFEIKHVFKETRFVLIKDKSQKASFALNKEQTAFFNQCYEVSSQRLYEEDNLPEFSYKEVKIIVRNELAKRNYQHINLICFDEGNLILSAELREELSISGEKPEEILPFRDKLLMKEILAKNNIRVPKYTPFDFEKALFNPLQYFNLLSELLGKPFVVKPRSYASSFGVFIIKNLLDFKEIINYIKKFSILYEAEEYIGGVLYHCETLLNQGKIEFMETCETSYPQLEFASGKNILTLPLKSQDPLRKDIFNFNKNCLAALNAKLGNFHLELFKIKNELVFIEIAARAPGALIIPLYKKMFGINLIQQELYIRLGFKKIINKSKALYCMSGWFPKKPGKVKKIEMPVITSEFEINWVVKQGDVLDKCHSLADYSASLLAWNRDYEILKSDFNKLKKYKPLSLKN